MPSPLEEVYIFPNGDVALVASQEIISWET